MSKLTRISNLNPTARDLAQRAMRWLDTCWDAKYHFFHMPNNHLYEAGALGVPGYMVRETIWYAIGLLMRNDASDAERAHQAIRAVLAQQYDTPQQAYHGTWRRSPYEPDPPAEAQIWQDYDPNWREFIGTSLAVLLLEYQEQLEPELIQEIDHALLRAVDGTIARNVSPSYTNIALMCAFLLHFAAERFAMPQWNEQASQLASAVIERFDLHGSFDEYNSPTYYGVDLYALALWRNYASLPLLRDEGARIEATLWRDIAQFYHAGMRNIAGPYDRSYGMNMVDYVAGLGMWIWLATGYAQAPFPDLSKPLVHGWDFAIAPVYSLLGLRIPSDVQAHFLAFQGKRQVERIIAQSPRRTASAWLSNRLMLGAEDSGSSHIVNSQFHPVTIHWQATDTAIGWMRVQQDIAIDAQASANKLAIQCSKHPGGSLALSFELYTPLLYTSKFQADSWLLPRLQVNIDTNADHFEHQQLGNDGQLRYHYHNLPANHPIHITLHFEAL